VVLTSFLNQSFDVFLVDKYQTTLTLKSLKKGPVLRFRELGPDLGTPSPEPPVQGWGRHYLGQTVAFSRRGRNYLLELLLLALS
jgi:hypothetical protein